MTCAVAYLRTSSATNVGGDSDVRQRVAITSYAASAGLEIKHEFYDASVSGADPLDARAGFVAMLAWCREHGCRAILVETASRFARDLMVQELGFLMLCREGFELIAVDKPEAFRQGADPMTKAFRQIIGVMMELDKAMNVARLKGARDRRSQAAGRRIEGRKGYAETQPELVAMVCKLSAEGKTQREIAAALNAEGKRTAKGTPFTQGQVSRLLAHVQSAAA